MYGCENTVNFDMCAADKSIHPQCSDYYTIILISYLKTWKIFLLKPNQELYSLTKSEKNVNHAGW